MNIATKLACVAATFAAAGLMSVPAQAATAHCPGHRDGNKVEINADDVTTVQTTLSPGTEVCIKAGTEIATVVVQQDGTFTNDVILNEKGKARGISYYVPGEDCETSSCP